MQYEHVELHPIDTCTHAWAARSHQRAHAAWESGELAAEVVPVEVPQRKGDPVSFERDEGEPPLPLNASAISERQP